MAIPYYSLCLELSLSFILDYMQIRVCSFALNRRVCVTNHKGLIWQLVCYARGWSFEACSENACCCHEMAVVLAVIFTFLLHVVDFCTILGTKLRIGTLMKQQC